jgi:chemotaxis protein histidine kinase CheA
MQLPGRLETPQQLLRMARGGKLEVPVKLVKQTDELKGNITVGVVGLPQRINQNNPGIAPDAEGKLQLDLQADVVAGRYTIFFRGDADIQQFRRRPELEDRAKEDRDRIIKVQQELEQAYQKSTQGRQQAERDHQQATQEQTNTNNEKNRLAQVAAQAEQQSQQAAVQADQAKQAHDQAVKLKTEAEAKVSEASDEDAKKAAEEQLRQADQQVTQAKTNLDAATKQAQEKAAAAKQAADDAAAAAKKSEEAVAKTKQAELAKQKAMEAETAARQDRDQGNQVRQQADQAVQRVASITRQHAIKAAIHSPALTLEIVPYPCDVKLSSDRLTVRAGEEAELAASVEREFDFTGEVTFAIQPPSGVGGWSLSQNAKIEREKDDGKFTLRIDQSAPPGEHQGELVVRMQFNNRPLEQRMPIHVKVEPKPPSP